MFEVTLVKLAGMTRGFRSLVRRPSFLVFLPTLALAAFWFGGETYLIVSALLIPLLYALSSAFEGKTSAHSGAGLTNATGLLARNQLISTLDHALNSGAGVEHRLACFVISIDDSAKFIGQYGRSAEAAIWARCADRLCSVQRQGDSLIRLEGGAFAIALGPTRRLDLETVIEIAVRFQAAIAAPLSLNATTVYVTASVGFCLGGRAPKLEGQAILDAAMIACNVATRHGPSAIRAFDVEMSKAEEVSDALRAQMELALDRGEIHAYFQPQISTDTGEISGFEALARWHHPQRGILYPSDFLSLIEENGLCDRLGEVMLYQALQALKGWEAIGYHIPTVAVNFSAQELRNPKLVQKLRWEMDRFDLENDRLCIEILETVISSTESDVIVSNIAALAKLGFGIDLDDFGTGNASITSIRRFAVKRLKVDRSFVSKLDLDPSQHKMVAAVLSLAEQLGLSTLAEGVETPGEHAALAQLGCQHVQGYVIAKPMPYDKTLEWISTHQQSLPLTLAIKHGAS
jgi:predicted signal transduction protein with EAL and GGDEF domain